MNNTYSLANKLINIRWIRTGSELNCTVLYYRKVFMNNKKDKSFLYPCLRPLRINKTINELLHFEGRKLHNHPKYYKDFLKLLKIIILSLKTYTIKPSNPHCAWTPVSKYVTTSNKCKLKLNYLWQQSRKLRQ